MTATSRTFRFLVAVLITAGIYLFPRIGGSYRGNSAWAWLVEVDGELAVVSEDDPRWDAAVGSVSFTNDRRAFVDLPFPTTEETTRRFSVTLEDQRTPAPDTETLQRLRREMRSVMEAEGRDASDLAAVLLPDYEATRPIWWGIIGNVAVFCLIVWLISMAFAAIDKVVCSGRRKLASMSRKEALTRGVCPSCGYDIRHLPQPRCPECGETWDREENAEQPPKPGGAV